MFENGQPPFAQRNVATYWIDLTEVTVAAYDECVNAGVCTPPAVDPTDPNPQWCNWQVAGREDHPVNCVDWSQADAYCAWAGKRLPDEWEWEWAARGRDAARPYPWGDEFPSCMRAWMIDDAAGGPGRGTLSTASVGSKPSGASRDGVLDLGGSVWEWTASVAESDAASRMQRGASFDNRGTVVFLAYHRVAVPATAGWSSDGFRCAQTP
jgi:formylglycine-generating enzyme required for sulfatase activity